MPALEIDYGLTPTTKTSRLSWDDRHGEPGATGEGEPSRVSGRVGPCLFAVQPGRSRGSARRVRGHHRLPESAHPPPRTPPHGGTIPSGS